MIEALPSRPDPPIVPHRRVSLVAFEEHLNSAQTTAHGEESLGKQTPQGSKDLWREGCIYLMT